MKIKELFGRGPVLIIIAAFLWALDGVVRRYLYTLPPLTIIFLEHSVGLIILTPFIWKSMQREKLSKKEYRLLFLVALLSGLLGTLWFTTALLKVHFISFSVVFLLQKLQPLFAIGSASIFLKEKLHREYIGWAMLALISAYFVTFPKGLVMAMNGEGAIAAALYALGAAFAWGTSTTFSKMILTKVSHTTSAFYRFLFTTIISLVLVIVLGYSSTVATVTAPQLGLFTLIALSTGMVALLIYYRGLAKTPVHISTILELTFPFIAICIDMTLYHTILTASQFIGAIALCFAIYKIARIREYDTTITTS